MLRRFLGVLTDIIYPKTCLACKHKLDSTVTYDYICGKCKALIKKNVPPFCIACGRHLEKGNLNKNICPSCLKNKLNFDRAFSPCLYEGVMKELIHEFKYKGKKHLSTPLSKLMIDFIKEYELPMDCLDVIIPVPLHKSRLREREFNQAQTLGSHIAAEFNKLINSEVLIRHRKTKTQAELALHSRLNNVRDSFSVAKEADIKNKNILLIDDVLTTGATSSEAAAALKKSGANIVFVLSLAN